MSLSERFANLFKGNERTFGQWDPIKADKKSQSYTLYKSATVADFEKHLSGHTGIGRVPILDDNRCWWGAIDIDSHGEDDYINIEAIAKAIYAKGFPLVACRSKSGGVHCYMFASEPIPAIMIKRTLQKWAKEIGYGGVEIFPKQSELLDNQNGNWINLPYFNSESTVRYAVMSENGKPKKLSIEEFIKYAESCKLSNSMLRSFVMAGHEQAPPCLQDLMIEGIPKGSRNEALYAFTVYLRKKLPLSSYKQAAMEINQDIFEPPLQISEANRTIVSASRREYRYKCTEEPCRSKCNSKECLTREYGIEPSDAFESGEGVPEFTGLRVINTEPPLWELTVNGVTIVVQTKVLRDFRLLAEEIMEKLLIVVPILKQKDWLPMLAEIMQKVERIEAPDNASVEGVIRERLAEFIDRADFNSNGKDPDDKSLILRGLPVIQEEGQAGQRIVMFRGTDFISYLKRTRSEELKGNSLWLALRKMGIKHKRSRIEGKVTNVWYIPVDGKGRTKLDFDYDPNSRFIHTNPEKVVKIMNKVNF